MSYTKTTVIIILIAAATTFGCSSKDADTPSVDGNVYKNYEESSDPATRLVKRCSTEAGIPENQPKHKITKDEMLRLTTCIDAATK